MTNIETFKQHLIEAEPSVMDQYGVHHEFVSGKHGQKIDFDQIATGSQLYQEWVEVHEQDIRSHYNETPQVILGVANGTNRLALDVARRFDGKSIGLVSEKHPEDSKKLYLPDISKKIIGVLKPHLAIVLEDVGTTGSNSVQVARAALNAGAKDVEVVVTWQRREQLEKLDGQNVKHRAVIFAPLPTYSPDECKTLEDGFCHQNWQFIPRPKS